ncbi:endonuclease/exonuclease/phosphatase family protein [Algoriphagus halophytocola]|uniref:Endonuclease/exonuclease/phosphatase family protein n=1 Tax=Algoriphagus halophytocola TaxID=2991499 RepID=A0ABY6MLH3_9BACT|nr:MULTISPECIES: endonuclease/exonuclease/phosphatase family protein [unclassified Algoriphagus]UZD24620.1 endonuclease/exonuclease/phosphatase family protein [Algoriphagus sp. TR-M5]WBL41988.1 endonuclease/exonuclease/phosphatase family protein [Algoriphagus sp. TR-M9]
MKKPKSNTLKICLILAILALGFHGLAQAQTHNFATFNIRYANQNDGGNLWQDRLPHVSGLIQFHQIELVGVQEALHNQLNDLSASLGFDYIGVGRDDGTEKGEYAAILYDKKKFKLLDEGTFWLSPTPDQPSKGWDAALNRICTWGKFKDEKGETFYVFNIHYDHRGQQAREESSKLVMQKVAEINEENAPAILMGDFNVTPENAAYTTITSNPDWKDARLISEIPAYGPSGTFTGFDWERMPEGIIDHIFVKGKLKVIRHGILSDNYGKKYPSDHFPVMVEVEWK